ncbi:MAG: NAD(P)H-dependent oxidoreductase [Microbacterium ginsengisoli]|jgi:putative NADPH-quinone reductase|uniref:NAD(P)H-dependent oxidoreductase n=1 Tax=Microbacterium TaxID=33882 RepID=UPI0006FB6A70|nr:MULTISPECIES: NAD(P)H-dependent oxidoreductase [Microbacterium]MBN9197210.1 NAD(P)H-dependent oxidoreductase [Microbacterium ginsengisoli]ODU52145.1 MAG: hypothetical protein ABT07_01515 [Microbacterium sp. SCN 70-10]KQR92934.1 hypothetical protein ASG00_01390 [Microbacterium sp. Leaf351]KQS05696.1 hypothetical protein ASF93_01840 [Microbacterium sp. Leaf347]KXC07212.1 hypothetical protein MhomT_01305 [Microbacterium hominis]
MTEQQIAEIIVVVGHPDLSESRINAALVHELEGLPAVQVRTLHELYPDGQIDFDAERTALESAQNIVLQYPLYWYSTPGLLKQWLDEIMTRGWAYGTGKPGVLKGKTLRVAISNGGVQDAYQPEGFHGWPIRQVLIPMEALAKRLGVIWLEPQIIHGTWDLTDEQLAARAARYRELLTLRDLAA